MNVSHHFWCHSCYVERWGLYLPNKAAFSGNSFLWLFSKSKSKNMDLHVHFTCMLNKMFFICCCLLSCLSGSKNHLWVGGTRSYIPLSPFGTCSIVHWRCCFVSCHQSDPQLPAPAQIPLVAQCCDGSSQSPTCCLLALYLFGAEQSDVSSQHPEPHTAVSKAAMVRGWNK